MEGSATASEVLEVAEAFERDIARENAAALEIRLESAGRSTDFRGADLSPEMADSSPRTWTRGCRTT